MGRMFTRLLCCLSAWEVEVEAVEADVGLVAKRPARFVALLFMFI